MRVKIHARSPVPGVHFLARAGRFFSSGETREIEVLDQDDDPPEIQIERVNASTGRKQMVGSPDPDRMGRRSYQEILDDTRLSVHETGAISGAIADSQVQAARALSVRLTGQVADLEVENAKLTAQLAAALEEIEDLKGEPEKEDAGESTTQATGDVPSVETTPNAADPEIVETETTTVETSDKPKAKRGR
jgi:hypothetical protein